jgi:predicted phosphodiesterase
MRIRTRVIAGLVPVLLVGGGCFAAFRAAGDFDFAILGDRTGEAVAGVWEEAWRETNLDDPAFVVTVGDTIQGLNDHRVETEWEEAEAVLAPYRHYKIFFTPGNHDVWSPASARAYIEHTRHPLHYGFDFEQAHFTVLDDSESDEISSAELAFLEKDLAAHEKQPVKFILSHRPAWILPVVLGNPAFPLHRLAVRYGVKYVIAGHIHQMLHFELEGVTYLSIASSGGHLRESKSYERGWFFQHTLAKVHGDSVNFEIKELTAPYGQGRVTAPADWGAAGLRKR